MSQVYICLVLPNSSQRLFMMNTSLHCYNKNAWSIYIREIIYTTSKCKLGILSLSSGGMVSAYFCGTTQYHNKNQQTMLI